MATYTPRLPLAEFQLTGLQKAARAPFGGRGFAWLMEMGARKTATQLAEWTQMVEAGEVADMLVVAPAGCYRNWTEDGEDPSEARKHLDPALFERTVIGTWRSGAGKAARERLGRMLDLPLDRPRILAVNVEAVDVPAARQLCNDFLSRRRALVVVDESPIIKNWQAGQTKIVMEFGQQAPYRRDLSGLVAPNGPLDLFSQFEFLDWRIFGQRSFFGFRNRYAIVKRVQQGGLVVGEREDGTKIRQNIGGRPKVHTVDMVVGYRNEDELHQRIEPFSYRVLKTDVLKDLPPKIYMPLRYVEMTKEQERVYADLKRQATAQLDAGNWVSPQLPITLMLRLHQVLCGHVTDDEGVVRPVATNRVNELLAVQDQHPKGRKIIVWAHYREAVELIAERLRKEFGPRAVALFYGANAQTRHEDEGRFKGDPDCRFMVSSQGAGGQGNNWQVADLAIYYASTPNLNHRGQSEDRPWRDGQTRPVGVMDLVVPGTVDMSFIHALREKINLNAVINGDNWREWVV